VFAVFWFLLNFMGPPIPAHTYVQTQHTMNIHIRIREYSALDCNKSKINTKIVIKSKQTMPRIVGVCSKMWVLWKMVSVYSCTRSHIHKYIHVYHPVGSRPFFASSVCTADAIFNNISMTILFRPERVGVPIKIGPNRWVALKVWVWKILQRAIPFSPPDCCASNKSTWAIYFAVPSNKSRSILNVTFWKYYI